MSNDNETVEQYAERVAHDHYLHWAVMIALTVWVWSNSGWIFGLAFLFGVILVVGLTNTLILAISGSFRAVRINRWAWPLVSAVLIVASTATSHQVP